MKFAWKWSKIYTFYQIHPFIHSFVQLYHSLTFRSIGWSMDTQSTLPNLRPKSLLFLFRDRHCLGMGCVVDLFCTHALLVRSRSKLHGWKAENPSFPTLVTPDDAAGSQVLIIFFTLFLRVPQILQRIRV